jgi:hypothetical protein
MKKGKETKEVKFDYVDEIGSAGDLTEYEIMQTMSLFRKKFSNELSKKEMEQELKRLRRYLGGL